MLPDDSKARKEHPIASGFLDYFPDAVAAVSHVSWIGNEKHNPGQKLHWSRDKSSDHADCIGRHLLQRGTFDADDGLRHSAKLAWRALALLQLELEASVGWSEVKAKQAGIAPKVEKTLAELRSSGLYNKAALAAITTEASGGTPVGGAAIFTASEIPPGLAAKNLPQPFDYATRKAFCLPIRGTIYISGPMRGKKDFNFPAFDAARDRFYSWGYKVISPADMDRANPTQGDPNDRNVIEQFVARDVMALLGSTHIAMLPGWENSRGAQAEYYVARWLGLEIRDAETGDIFKW